MNGATLAFAGRLTAQKRPFLFLDAAQTLRRVLPDARFIWTHRDPAEALGSVCSLITYLRAMVSDRSDPTERCEYRPVGVCQAEASVYQAPPTRLPESGATCNVSVTKNDRRGETEPY